MIYLCTKNFHIQQGWTPLYIVAERNYGNIAQVLIQNGAELDVKDKVGKEDNQICKTFCMCTQDGTTPLMVACSHDRKDTVKVLLQYNPQINCQRYVS